MSINSVSLVGRLTKDPMIKEFGNDGSVARFSLALNRVWYGADKQKKEEVTFVNCVAWGNLARTVARFATKGSQLAVHGRLQMDEFDDKEGNTRKELQVVADNIELGHNCVDSESGNGDGKATPVKKDAAPSYKGSFKNKASKPEQESADNQEEVSAKPTVKRAF